MDAFEEIVAGLFRTGLFEGKRCWTWTNYKINLEYFSDDEKKEIGGPSVPRPELDILGYVAQGNSLLWVECKSYLDSLGVNFDHLIDSEGEKYGGFPKVFANDRKRSIIGDALIRQVTDHELACPNPMLYYCFVAGNIHGLTDEKFGKYEAYLRDRDPRFRLYGPHEIRNHLLTKHADKTVGYENDVITMLAKLILRP